MRKLSLLITLSFLIFFNTHVFSQVAKFKAAYTYNIARFVEWPKSARSGDFIIGVIANKKVHSELSKLARVKKIAGRKIVVKNFASVRNAKKCHILFIGASQTRRLPEAVVKVGKNPTLLISEKNGAIYKGSAINFIIQRKKLRFEIKKVNATRQGLKVSSSINKLAAKVY